MTSGHAPTLYDPDWLSLLDARERLKAKGAEAVEAETAICLVLRDGKLKVHITIEKVTYAPTRATLSAAYVRSLEFKEGIKLRLCVPFDLKPEDIDWDNSHPTRAWPYGPWQDELLAHVARIEVWRADFERAFPMLQATGVAELALQILRSRRRPTCRCRRHHFPGDTAGNGSPERAASGAKRSARRVLAARGCRPWREYATGRRFSADGRNA